MKNTIYPCLLDVLPIEIIIQILASLDYRQLLRCRSVCQHLNRVIATESVLQYTIEVAMDCVVPHQGDKTVACADHLSKLRGLRKGWRTLNWKSKTSIRVQGSCNSYELVDGYFVKIDIHGNILVLELPSATGEGRIVCNENLSMIPGDFALDPTQDVIIFLKPDDRQQSSPNRMASVHVRTISTREVHPSAARPIISFDVTQSSVWGNSFYRVLTQLVGDVFAVFISTGAERSRLLIWNWMKGNLIFDSNVHALPEQTFSFSFIDSRSFIATSLRDSGSIHIFSFEDLGSENGPTHVAALLMPELNEYAAVHQFWTHCEPFYGEASNKSFSTSKGSRLHVMTIQYVTVRHFIRTEYTLFIHNQVLLNYMEDYKRGRSTEAPVVPWSEWGPENTRFLDQPTQYSWLRYVQGQRVVCPSENGCVQVLDFNFHPSQLQQFIFQPEITQNVWTTPTIVAANDIFKSDVESKLPYFISRRRMTEDYDAYMIDQERILGLKVENTQGDETISQIDVFSF